MNSTAIPEQAIAEARESFVAALGRGDARAASQVYTHGARLLGPSAELIEGREAIAAYWRAGLEAGVSSLELETLDFQRHDSVAYEIGRYSLRVSSAESGTVVDRGKYALVHERQADGSWLRAVEAFNPELPPTRADETATMETGRDAGVQNRS